MIITKTMALVILARGEFTYIAIIARELEAKAMMPMITAACVTRSVLILKVG